MTVSKQSVCIHLSLLFLLIETVTLSSCTNTNKDLHSKPNQIDPIQEPNETTFKCSFILYPSPQTIRVKTTGKIEFLKTTGVIKKGQRIALLNNEAHFQTISTKKLSLKNDLNALIPEFPSIIAEKTTKWQDYSASISTKIRLPKVPKFEYKEEVDLLNSIQFIEKVNEIIILESKMKSFFCLAPCSGVFVAEERMKSRKNVKSGDVIGTILPAKKALIHVSKKDWDLCKGNSNRFSSDGKTTLTNWKKATINSTDSLAFEVQTSNQITEKRAWIPIQ